MPIKFRTRPLTDAAFMQQMRLPSKDDARRKQQALNAAYFSLSPNNLPVVLLMKFSR
jgi:hypothetical protein